MEAFLQELEMTYGNWWFLLLNVALLLVGLIICKGYKKNFLIPALIVTVGVINPLFYNIWYKINDRSYWRMLWIVPLVAVCAMVPAYLIDKSKKSITAICILAVFGVLFVNCGRFVFDETRQVFSEANNPEKLPNDVVAIGEMLIEQEEYPTVVSDASISVYLRQYSGRIRTPYARSIVYGNPSGNSSAMYSLLLEGNMIELAQRMLNYDYDYLVTIRGDELRQEALNDAGFENICDVGEYGIYQVHGFKTEKRIYNDYRQVTSMTYVNEEGIAKLNDKGFATIGYLYDDYHRLCGEQFFDLAGNAVNSTEGYSEIRYVYTSENTEPYMYFYDFHGKQLDMGSGYLHEYLKTLSEDRANKIIIIAVKDEASYSLTDSLCSDFKAIGLKCELQGRYRNSYYALVTDLKLDEITSSESLSYETIIKGHQIQILSEGALVGDSCSIQIDGIEHAKNKRGLNIVVYEPYKDEVIDSVAFDTHSRNITVFR